MQIIESTDWGVRSARLSFRHPAGGKTVVLFPMIHVGEPSFYTAVYTDAFSQGAVLVEGVKSPITTRVTRSYRWIEGAKNIGLIVQPKYPSPEHCQAKIIQADLSAQEFTAVWREVPLWQRALIYVVAPLMGLDRRWFGSREKIAKGLSLEDAESQKELLNWSAETAFLDRAVLHARDERLIERLREQIADPSEAPASIAVVYGARHMRAVLRELTTVQGFACVGADWMMVFSL
jgi:hypothetical protein